MYENHYVGVSDLLQQGCFKLLFILTVLTASCEPYSKKHKTNPNRNQRIIKVQGPPHYNHFHGHQKPVRKRPFGTHHGDEFIRPNHPPPSPSFFNGPSTNHIKHLPRSPPHVFHKSPSYGLGFPYKSFSSYNFVKRPSITKDQFRVQSVSSLPVRPATGSSSNSVSVSSSTKYNSPTFSSNSFISSPVPHIISSDDNNGPIREIPAPNLAPKPQEGSFSTISVVSDISGIGGINGIGNVGSIEGISGIGGIRIEGVSGIGDSKIQGSDIGVIGGVLHSVRDINGGDVSHGASDLSVAEGIHGVSGDEGVNALSNVASTGGVTHLEPEELLHSIAKNPNGVNLDAIVKDQGLEINTYIKESSGDVHHDKGSTVEIANFDEGSSIDVTNLIKDAASMPDYHSGYEVTEHHNHLPSNDQIIKGHDGTKFLYAPDPDPSLPVHKVPPTNDPHSTPSNGQNVNNVYIPQISHRFPYFQGGSVGMPLSSQELFQLIHGYPAVISQPVVAFVSQTPAPGIILSDAGQNYFPESSGTYGGGHYSQDEEGNDISQYLKQPDIHNLLHNSPESHHEQESIKSSYSSVVSQSVYSPQNQYRSYLPSQYQTSVKNSGSETSGRGNFATSEINHNYQYEPEASETDNRNSLTVIKQTNEGTLNSETVKELLLEDSAMSDLNQEGKEGSSESVPTILQLKHIPEVPFYATLPSKKAAEALASLQAAGSVASNYMNRIKIKRGDGSQDEKTEKRKRKLEEDEFSENAVQSSNEKIVVEVQQSVPLYETSISSKNLVESGENKQNLESHSKFSSEGSEVQYEDELNNFDFKEDGSNETFGKRIRPK